MSIEPESLGMPADAKRVFEGVVWDIWQWEQELYDGSVTTFEGAARKPAGVAIALVGDKIVMLNEDQPGREGMISLPGGCADSWDEGPLEVAKRELLEETGMESKEWEGFMMQKIRSKTRWDIHFYLARNCQKTQEPAPGSGERMKVNLLSFDEFIDIGADIKFRNINLIPILLQAKYEPEKKEELRQKILGKG